jgi:ketosteroid isomerase-like protein
VSDIEATVQALAERVRVLEDQLAIYRLVASYGPAVDSGNADAVGRMWTEDGVYDVDTPGPLEGRASVSAMVAGKGHQSLIHGGAGHVMAMPVVTLDGDRAVATGYSRLYLRDGDGFRVWRVAANRWELQRTADGWQVTNRVNRVLDGRADARELLGRAAG